MDMDLLKEYQQHDQKFLERNPGLRREMQERGIVDPLVQVRLQNLAGGPQDAAYVEALVASFDTAPTPADLQTYIRLLAGTKHPFDPRRLVEEFCKSNVYHEKSAILRTIVYSGAIGRSEWLIGLIKDRNAGEFREIATAYIPELPNAKSYLPILRELFTEIPVNATRVFFEIGGEEELEVLKKYRHEGFSLEGKDKRVHLQFLERTIDKIERKLARKVKNRSG